MYTSSFYKASFIEYIKLFVFSKNHNCFALYRFIYIFI